MAVKVLRFLDQFSQTLQLIFFHRLSFSSRGSSDFTVLLLTNSYTKNNTRG